MIRFTLKCDRDHSFESWFNSAESFDKLVGEGLLACAVCGSHRVGKAMMAPGVRTARQAAAGPAPEEPAPGPGVGTLSRPASAAEQAVRELRARIEARSQDVGRDFPREARAIHAGTAPERPIIGQARPDEARSLIEDGIPVAPLPWGERKTN